MARPERFERPTPWFVAKYSIQLSYGRGIFNLTASGQRVQQFSILRYPIDLCKYYPVDCREQKMSGLCRDKDAFEPGTLISSNILL